MELVTRSTLSGRAGIVPNQPGGRHASSARLRQSQVGRAAGREDPAQIPVPAQPAPGFMNHDSTTCIGYILATFGERGNIHNSQYILETTQRYTGLG